MKKQRDHILIRNAKIGFREFAGSKGVYNPDGKRTFAVFFENSDELVDKLIDDGWNIKYTKPREDGEDPTPFLSVTVMMDNEDADKNAHVVQVVTDMHKIKLNKDTIAALDRASLIKVDMTIRPYDWSFAGKSGRTAYLVNMFATIELDDLEMEYMDIPYADD